MYWPIFILKVCSVHIQVNYINSLYVNSFLARGDLPSADNLCKPFGPDQDQQNVGADLDPKQIFDSLIVFLKEIFEQTTTKA